MRCLFAGVHEESRTLSETGFLLAHGVGTVYELPLPLPLYLGGAATAVLGSFLVQAFGSRSAKGKPPRRIARRAAANALVETVRAIGLVMSLLTLIFAFLDSRPGLTVAPLLFWVGLVIGGATFCALVSGVWERANPWVTIESFYEQEPRKRRVHPPWWLGPVLVYALFWFELVSGKGFDPMTIVWVLTGYTFYVLLIRPYQEKNALAQADPISIIFGFASRSAPFVVDDDGISYRGPVQGLIQKDPMPTALFASLFIMLSSTTVDNIKETVAWSNFLGSSGLEVLPDMLLESLALLFFALPFYVPFMATMLMASRWSRGVLVGELSRRYAWSLAPIGVAYVLAHNMPLLIIGLPSIVNGIAGQFGVRAFDTYVPSAKLVWFLEIGLIVGGHVIGVLAAHRISLRTTATHRAAIRSHIALSLLMTVFTFTTLLLLSQPIVTRR